MTLFSTDNAFPRLLDEQLDLAASRLPALTQHRLYCFEPSPSRRPSDTA